MGKVTLRRRWFGLTVAAGAILVLLVASLPWIVPAYWKYRSSNPVRRGVRRATSLGCFQCHGWQGGGGIPDPKAKGDEDSVPAWGGGVWMMYVKNDEEIRDYILNGSKERHDEEEGEEADREHTATGASPEHVEEETSQDGHVEGVIEMPAFGSILTGSDLDDLTAAFKVISGMIAPPSDSPASRGRNLARKWRCFSCHGPAASGGFPNPGSFTGFIPGWYGADFRDLVRSREEFDHWVRTGGIDRLRNHPIASYFIERQKITMPPYRNLTSRELDDLWAYTRWLADTDGGYQGEPRRW